MYKFFKWQKIDYYDVAYIVKDYSRFPNSNSFIKF